jgi:hypothetical protein
MHHRRPHNQGIGPSKSNVHESLLMQGKINLHCDVEVSLEEHMGNTTTPRVEPIMNGEPPLRSTTSHVCWNIQQNSK